MNSFILIILLKTVTRVHTFALCYSEFNIGGWGIKKMYKSIANVTTVIYNHRMALVGMDPMSNSCNSVMRLQEFDGTALNFLSLFFAFLYVLRNFHFSYTYEIIIQNFDHAWFKKKSPYAHAAPEKHFCILTPVFTHVHMLIDFDNARILQTR